MSNAELIEEIKQITSQYHAEVGRGRKAWPNSIKDRVLRLFESGMKAPAIAKETGLSYFTVLKWRPGGKKCAPRGKHGSKFKELTVVAQNRVPVTVANQMPSQIIETEKKVAIVTVTTPQGFRVEVQGVACAAVLLKELMKI